MASIDTAKELVKLMLAEGKTGLKIEIEHDTTRKKYFVLVREAASGDIVETRSILYPSASKVCERCGR